MAKGTLAMPRDPSSRPFQDPPLRADIEARPGYAGKALRLERILGWILWGSLVALLLWLGQG